MTPGSAMFLKLDLRIAGLAVRVGAVEGVEPFVTAALEGLDPRRSSAAHRPEQGAKLVASCLTQLPVAEREAPMLLLLGATPDPATPWAAHRAADLASALEFLAKRTPVQAVVMLATDGSDGVAIALVPAGTAVPAMAELQGLRVPPPGDPAAHGGLLLVPPGMAVASSNADVSPGWPAGGLPGPLQELTHLAQAAVCLHRLILPARPRLAAAAMPATQDRLAVWPPAAGLRRCTVLIRADDGNLAVDLAEAPLPRPPARARIADRRHVLLPFSAASPSALATALEDAAASAPDDLHAAGRAAHALWRQGNGAPLAAALVASDAEQMRIDAQFFARLLRSGDIDREWRTPTGSVLTGRPARGDVAFVYPGFASAYVGAGRQLGYLFPELQERLIGSFGVESCRFLHLDRLSPRTGRAAGVPLEGDLRGLCEATTTFAAVYTTLARDVFRLQPRRAIGYSVGEPAMLFALGVWTDTATFSHRLDALLTHRLGGEMRDVRDYWAACGRPAPPGEAAWAAVLVRAPVADIAAAASAEPGCFLPLINTPGEAVLAGHPVAVRRAAAHFAGRAMPLETALPLHCAAVRSMRAEFVAQHDLPTIPPEDVVLYGSGRCDRVMPERGALAEAIADSYTRPVDFPRLVRQAYADGARVFIEMGPRRICSTWIDEILAGRLHVAVPLDLRGVDDEVALLRGLAQLVAHQAPVRLDLLYEAPTGVVRPAPGPGCVAPALPRGIDAASERIADLIVAEVAALLGCNRDMIDRRAPLLGFGIDSLAVAGLAQRAERAHGVRLELNDIVEAGTIEGLAELIHVRRLASVLVRMPVAADAEALRL